jgi:hypothetical protein
MAGLAGLDMARSLRRGAIVGLGLLLVACGGSASGGPATPPPVLPDCVWGVEANARLDSDGDGVRDGEESALPEVRFIVADTLNGYPDVGRGMSDAGGRVRLTVFLPGCSQAIFVVSAEPPAGYRPTTRASMPTGENAAIEFGFRARE